MTPYYHLKASGVQHMFNIKGGNHETVLTSERYLTKQGAQGGIASIKVNAPIDARYISRTSAGGAPYFVLKAANGEIIGTSEMYSTAAARDVGIAWVKMHAPTANTVE